MAKIVYVSYEKSEGMMNSLGFETISIEKNVDFKGLVRQLRQKDVSIIYVTESVYEDFQEIIGHYNKEFDVTISILPNTLHHHGLAQKRLKQLTAEALGVTIS